MDLWLVARWVLVFAGLTVVGAPIAAALFDRLPRKGAAFALPAAVVPLTIVVFWIGRIAFGTGTVWFGAATVGVLSVAAYVRGHRPDWTAVAGAYAVFALGFGFMLLFRGANPGITPYGGEHFLHFGVMKAIMRADALPPGDFWYAGKDLQYYYGTQLQVVEFSILTDTPLRKGMNLGVAAVYGMLVVVAYGLVGSILARADRSYHAGGVLGAFFVAGAGATTTAVRLGTPHLPDGVGHEVTKAAFGFHAARFEGGNLTASVQSLSRPEEWSWWYTRYVVEGTLQEFPMYSFVKADLHGHAMANGYLLFAAALAFVYYLTPREKRKRRLAILFVGMGAVGGLFGFMNTWSLPAVVGLAWLSVAAAGAHPATLVPETIRERLSPAIQRGLDGLQTPPDGTDRRAVLAHEAGRVVSGAFVAGLVGLIGVAIASPFLVFGSVPQNEGVGLLPPRSQLGPFLVIYGGLLALFLTFLAVRARNALEEGRPTTIAAAITIVVSLLVAFLFDFHVLVVTVPPILAGWWLLRTDRAGFETVLIVGGLGLLLSMELLFAKVYPWPHGHTRWNTSLKVAVQGWTLGAAGGGAAAALLFGEAASAIDARLRDLAGGQTRSASVATDSPGTGPVAAVVVVMILLAVIATSAPFAAMTVKGEVLEDLRNQPGEDEEIGLTNVTGYNWNELSLDGLAHYDRIRRSQMAAIYWLDDREGTPTIAEAPGREYGWMNPASTLTGVPTVVGWDHQVNFRGDEAYHSRTADVDALYNRSHPWSRAVGTLETYEVEYVYVGEREREVYGTDLRPFDRNAFTVANETASVTIYEVNQTALNGG